MSKKRIPDPASTKRINPFLQIPYIVGTTPRGFLHDWINSDEYKRRLTANKYNDPNSVINKRLDSLEKSTITHSNAKSVASPLTEYNNSSNININNSDSKIYGDNIIIPHELAHLIGGSFPNQYPSSMNIFEKNLLDISNINRSSNPHEAIAPEMKSDLDSNRYNLFRNNIYDIKQGKPFTKDHLDKAKELFHNDESFNRLIKQTGNENYIKLMNTIASNKKPDQVQSKYRGKLHKQYNPFLDEYFLGGLLGKGFTSGEGSVPAGAIGGALSGLIPTTKKDGTTSVGGSVASGALSGFASGAALGPIGMIGGALIGGVSGLIGGKKSQKEDAVQHQLELDRISRETLATMNYGIGNGSNLPMAIGGSIDQITTQIPLGSYNYFPVGGTHESNPNGGIPQGVNSQGQQMTTEEDEGAFQFKDGKYIFSNRLTFE